MNHKSEYDPTPPPFLVGPKQCLMSSRVGVTPGAENTLLLGRHKNGTKMVNNVGHTSTIPE